MFFYKKWDSSLKSEDRSLLTSDFGLLTSHPNNIINFVTLKQFTHYNGSRTNIK